MLEGRTLFFSCCDSDSGEGPAQVCLSFREPLVAISSEVGRLLLLVDLSRFGPGRLLSLRGVKHGKPVLINAGTSHDRRCMIPVIIGCLMAATDRRKSAIDRALNASRQLHYHLSFSDWMVNWLS